MLVAKTFNALRHSEAAFDRLHNSLHPASIVLLQNPILSPFISYNDVQFTSTRMAWSLFVLETKAVAKHSKRNNHTILFPNETDWELK